MKAVALLCVLAVGVFAAENPAWQTLNHAFDALRARDYDTAIAAFRLAATEAPERADIHVNLAYTLLKTGDGESARTEFGEAMRLDPADSHVTLEYAFLCYEAKDDAPMRKAEARRIFARIRDSRDSKDDTSPATAAVAFRNIDEPLRAGIDRWQNALAVSVPTFSAHYELAQLAEERDDRKLAAENYKAAFRLSPERRSVLLDLARVDSDETIPALIAASRGPEPRTAELARERLPARYPYVYEFRQAVELDPTNEALRRELAFLLLRMLESGQATRDDAEKEFAELIGAFPNDMSAKAQLRLLQSEDAGKAGAVPVLQERNRVEPQDARLLGERSYQAGFFKDALRYFTLVHETNPADSAIALKLGWTNNLLHDDVAALRWFNVARQSGDPAIAAEAQRAWRNLHPSQERIRTTLWMYPLFSSRWSDLFGYGQLKAELRWKRLPLHPYASIRLAGDVRRSTGGPLPQSLSESAFIAALGLATNSWHGALLWGEAGVATSYLNGARWSDYRGGLSYARSRGASLGGEKAGWFLETLEDSVYVSHFDRDLINYAQLRAGYTDSFHTLHAQIYWGQNFTVDAKREYWANFTEAGPGIRIHPPGLPESVWLNVSAVRGVYLRNEGNPGRPNFNDVRVGIWYASTK